MDTPAPFIEPLEQLAKLAWEQAPTLCDPQLGCCDYHRCWSLVRWLNQDGALPANNQFYLEELGALAEQGRTRVLISGAADTGLMAMVLAAYGRHNMTPDIVLVDQCRTPVAQCRRFAEQLGLTAELLERDVRTLQTRPVDAVVAHSFLHFFTGDERQAVTGSWRRLLKPGGRLILSNSLAISESSGPPARSHGEIVSQAGRLVEKARRLGFERNETAELTDALVRFWQQNRWQKPYITEANLRELLTTAGFSVDSFSVDSSPGAAPSRAFDRQSPRRRVQISARRL